MSAFDATKYKYVGLTAAVAVAILIVVRQNDPCTDSYGTSPHCTCKDPSVATERPLDPSWQAQHDKYRRLAAAPAPGGRWNAVFLGDSIIERWMGPRGVGRVATPEYGAGMALGSSGDISTELLWHLQNGRPTSSCS